jgi:hypothetical protein
MVLAMQRGTTVFLVAKPELGVRSDVRDLPSDNKIVLADPNPDADWDKLMAETEVEWSQTLEYLGR